MKRIAMTLLAVLLLCGILSGCVPMPDKDTTPTVPEATGNPIDAESVPMESSPIQLNPELPMETIPPSTGDADYFIPTPPTIKTETQ